jgi:hypothetical protein
MKDNGKRIEAVNRSIVHYWARIFAPKHGRNTEPHKERAGELFFALTSQVNTINIFRNFKVIVNNVTQFTYK